MGILTGLPRVSNTLRDSLRGVFFSFLSLLVLLNCWSLLLLLLLMLHLELFIRLWGYFNLIAYPVVSYGFVLGRASNNLICEESLIDDPIIRSSGTEVLIVYVTILSWVYADEVSSLLILVARLSDKLSMPHSDCFSHTFMHCGHIVLRILLNVFLNHLQELTTCSLVDQVSTVTRSLVCPSLGRYASPLYASG